METKVKRHPRLSTTDLAKVSVWVGKNLDTTLDQSLNDRVRRIKEEIGVHLPGYRLSEIEEAHGVKRVKGGAADSRKDRIKVLANIVRCLMEKMGEDIPPVLTDLCNGR